MVNECTICSTQDPKFLIPSAEEKSGVAGDPKDCYYCWGPEVIKARTPPIPNELLWFQGWNPSWFEVTKECE